MRKRILAILMIGAIVMTAACSKPEKNTTAEAAPAPEPTKTVEAFGIIEANEIQNISLDIEAGIENVNVKEGQQVKKGDVLLALNMKSYMEKIKSKQHELSIIKLEAEKLKSENPDPNIEKLTYDLSFAEEQLRKASEELETQEKLYKAGVISKAEYDEYVKAVQSKAKSAEDIKYSLRGIVQDNELGLAIRSEKAAVIESDIRQMKDRLNKGFILGSNVVCLMENGIVYDLGYKAGDTINPEKKLLSLMNMDSTVVKADVAEEFVKDVKPGAKVEIIPVADKSRMYQGKVAVISNKAVVKNGETVIPVEISIDNKDGFLLPNFNVDVKIYME